MKNLQINYVLTVLLLAFMCNNTLAEEASSRNLIVGGSPVPTEKSYEWFVRFGGAKHAGDIPRFCGGALVSPEFVLTSARCLPLLDDGEQIRIGARCGGVADGIGGNNCGQYYEMRSIQRTILSKDFVNKPPFVHDLVLVQLNEPSTIEPVLIDDGSFTSKYIEGKELWAIGFGAKNILQNAEVKYGNQGECFKAWKKLNPNRQELDNSIMCADSLESSTYFFDTGGPLYDLENNVLVGIARWEDSKFAFKFGSIFSRLSQQFGMMKFKICQLTSSVPRPNICDNNPLSTPRRIEGHHSCDEGEVYVEFMLKTDNFGDTDNRVTIVDTTSGEEIESIDNMQRNYEYSIEKCLPCALYKLTIYDEYGDGLLSPGGFFVSVDGEIIASSWRKPEEDEQDKNVIGHALSILFNGSKCSSDLSTFSVTFQQGFKSSTQLQGSSKDLFEKIMESYTQKFAGSDEGVQTSCSVQHAVLSDRVTLMLVVYKMTFKSSYTDISSYGQKFKEYMNSNLSTVANDLIALDIVDAFTVYQMEDSPTTEVTETYYQEFDAASTLSNTGEITFKERMEYYAHFLFKKSENQFMASCNIVYQNYIASQGQLNIKYTVKFHSSKDISSYHDKFRGFINANLPKLTGDLSEFGVSGAKPAFLLV